MGELRLTPALGLVGLMCCSSATAEFIRPAKPADPPIFGVKGGIVVAVHPAALDGRPAGGPRGLLRVGYDDGGTFRLINYIAVEPLVGRARGFSELERGGDGQPGKRFRVADVRESPDGREPPFARHVAPF